MGYYSGCGVWDIIPGVLRTLILQAYFINSVPIGQRPFTDLLQIIRLLQLIFIPKLSLSKPLPHGRTF